MDGGRRRFVIGTALLCALAIQVRAQNGDDVPVRTYVTGPAPTPRHTDPQPARVPRPDLARVCRLDFGTLPRAGADTRGELRLTISAGPGFALSADDAIEVLADAPGLRFDRAETVRRSAVVGRGLDWVVLDLPFAVEDTARPGLHQVQVRPTVRLVREPSGEDLGWMTDVFTTGLHVAEAPRASSGRRETSPPRARVAGASDPTERDRVVRTEATGAARDLLQDHTAPLEPPPARSEEPVKPRRVGAVALLLTVLITALLFRFRNVRSPTR